MRYRRCAPLGPHPLIAATPLSPSPSDWQRRRRPAIRAMPLFARAFAMPYPDRERSPRLDHHIVLCGGLEVGGFYRIGSGPSEGRWSWGTTLGRGNRDFIGGGDASHA